MGRCMVSLNLTNFISIISSITYTTRNIFVTQKAAGGCHLGKQINRQTGLVGRAGRFLQYRRSGAGPSSARCGLT